MGILAVQMGKSQGEDASCHKTNAMSGAARSGIETRAGDEQVFVNVNVNIDANYGDSSCGDYIESNTVVRGCPKLVGDFVGGTWFHRKVIVLVWKILIQTKMLSTRHNGHYLDPILHYCMMVSQERLVIFPVGMRFYPKVIL